MARIQILELPDEEGDDGKTVTPFAIILDQFDVDESGPPFGIEHFAERCGARASLVSSTIIDIPGLTPEEIAAYGQRGNTPLAAAMPTVAQLEKAISRGLHFSPTDEATRNCARAIHDALAQQVTAEGATL